MRNFAIGKWILVGIIVTCISAAADTQSEEQFTKLRKEMVRTQLAARDITDPRVLEAMDTVPRHLFIDKAYRHLAYADHPLPIAKGQTITQPYIVALMTQLMEVRPGEKVLEIGTGSGYQAAVLSHLTEEVYTVEIIETLAAKASETFRKLGYDNVHVRWGDGNAGWEDEAPFDAIIITCATKRIPPALFNQLKEGGRIIVPLGNPSSYQTLSVITKVEGKLKTKKVLSVRFVPMTSKKRK